jgi:hypothetical protein
LANILGFGLLISIQGMGWSTEHRIQAEIKLLIHNYRSKPFSSFEPEKNQ